MPRFNSLRLFALLTLLGIVGAASAADQPAKCRYRLAGQLPLQYHGGSMSLTMEGQINRTPAVFLMDTGASDTFLTRLGTDRRSLWLNQTMGAVTGIGGITRLYRAPIRHLQIGPINSVQQSGSLLVIDEMGDRPDFDAIVGSDFLLTMDLEISLNEKLVKFFSPQNCEQTFLGYWDPAAVVVPMLSHPDDARPMMEVSLNGIKMTALIDTGANFSSVTRAAAAKAGVTPTSAGVRRAGEAVGVGRKKTSLHNAAFATFSVGEETINNPVLQLIESEHKRFDVILGTDFLRAHRVLLAASQKAVYLSYIGGQPFGVADTNNWIEKEATAGNSYGQFRMAMGALLSGDAKADAAGRAWLNKSASANNPLALHYLAKEHGRSGRSAESVAAYEKLIALDSYDLTTQLELFAMRTRTGKAAEAKTALTAAIAQFKWPRWPAPIADYYLGTSTLDDVLRQARKESDVAVARVCEVYGHAQAIKDALGQGELADALAAKAKESCT
ncbi:MAG: aspartyl protease family protein [Pseudomonadota bacterium]